jgi:hypothetical protein
MLNVCDHKMYMHTECTSLLQIGCVKSSLLNLRYLSTLNFPEKGGKTVEAVCLPVTAAWDLQWNSER